jgi:tRNA (guanine37-N1)-methyltransferase
MGDIALIEVAGELAPYEDILAQGILKVNRNVRVVLAKAGAVSGFERIRPIRYLAGENRTQTVHRESGCRFKVDLSKAYFSPRLSHEHQRVTLQVEPGEVVIDMFAGVGPFSVMIAKRLEDVEVNAVDANPDAVVLMRENARLNKVRGKLRIWPGDATEVVENHLTGMASRVIMNHPSAAKNFVSAACRGLRKEGGTIHYYTFAEGLNSEQQALAEFQEALQGCGWKVKEPGELRRVRGVSPMRWQVVVDAEVAPTRAIS